MSVSEEYLEFVAEQLQTIGEVTTKKMFGGAGIYHDGLFFALVANDILYFKVDDTNLFDYENAGMKPFKPFDNKPMTMMYYEVPVNVLEDPGELGVWAKRSIEVARKKPKKKKKRK